MDKAWFRKLFTRRIFVVVLLILQALLLAYLVGSTSQASGIVSVSLTVISTLVALYILSRPEKGPYRLTWIFVILSLPLFGGLLYLICQYQGSTRLSRLKFAKSQQSLDNLIMLPGNYIEPLVERYPEYTAQARYLSDHEGFPVSDCTEAEYLSPGERFYERVLEELKKAEKYIFIESFILQQGTMWDTVLELLAEKVERGVDVRLIYDDMGCFLKLPTDYRQYIESKGIKCIVFNPFRPFLSAIQNNRDHRKIVSIDGKVAFTGGNNFADEYINLVPRFGHWKDASVMLKGKAAWSLTVIFLELWSAHQDEDEDFESLYPWSSEPLPEGGDGFSLVYADSPLDTEHVGSNVFLQMINSAKEYLYINTPYLIIDDTLLVALSLCAKSGVDVRIVTPGIADKKIVHATTRSYYRELVEAGVKIYEYTPGFMHSKTVIADDKTGIIGTTNFDYRSLYLHFECGALLFGCSAIGEVKADFLSTLSQCTQITQEACKKSLIYQLFQQFLRLFAPLL